MANQDIFQRVEKKYQLNGKQYDAFLHALCGRALPDQYGLPFRCFRQDISLKMESCRKAVTRLCKKSIIL